MSNSYDDVIDLVDPSIMGTQMAVALELIRQAPSIVPQPPTPEPKPPAPPIPPFAAQFLVLPERHDGEKDFFFWLFFNQQPDELGRRTVWDGLLRIGGADIAVVRLLTPYTFWIVTVEPTQRGDITIRLPRRECTEVGSVCADGRPLSEGLSETVPGPDSRVTSNRNSPATGSPAIEGSPVGLFSDMLTVTLAATAAHTDATVTITPDDADASTDGHQVNAIPGDVRVVTITVTRGSDTEVYTINFSQP